MTAAGIMSEHIKISCVMPIYNAERYVEEAIQSILDQTFTDFELILVDDGSSDSSAEIIDRLAKQDSRIRVIRKENGGIVSALNKGIRSARGEYLARMDADDISLPDRFAFQARYLDEHPEVALIGGRSKRIGPTGAEEPSDWTTSRTRTDIGRFPPTVAVSLHPLIMTRRAAIVEVGGYSDKYPHAEDYDIFIKLGASGEVRNPEKDVLKYRVHGSNISLVHLEQQERSAIASEVDNVARFRERNNLRSLKVSKATLAGYEKIRVFRRRLGLNLPVGPRALVAAAADLARGAPSSEFYTTYRLFLMLGFNGWRGGRAKMRTAT